MVETICKVCEREISKHDPLALKVCLLKATREIERLQLSRKKVRVQTNNKKTKEVKYKM